MDTYPLPGSDGSGHYPARPQHWPPHLNGSGPQYGSQSPSVNEHNPHFSPFFSGPGQPTTSPTQPTATGDQSLAQSVAHSHSHHHLSRQSSSLSLNLSSLTVASPTNLSPINPPSATALSPVSPLSPANHPFGHHSHMSTHNHIGSPFQFPPPLSSDQQQQQTASDSDVGVPATYDQQQHQRGLRITTTSRSSSSSVSAPPSRKRSFTSNPSSTPLLEEPFDDARDSGMDFVLVDDAYPTSASTTGAGRGSPVDGSGSGGDEDGMGGGAGIVGGAGGMGMLGKPMTTNNFVTKLYQMINDPKSSNFISWTELGTSFVVSNVGEFSRSILGSHFKHNNFSSFVRQLNMYGFHKINRTPRAQRSSTDAQTWEFSHHKFLRGRPDLLDEIKRKALEPDPSMKHRVELPGEVAAQLNSMRDDNRRMWEQLEAERRKVERLTALVTNLWTVVGQCFPDRLPPLPQDLLSSDSGDSPNIYVTSPTSSTSRFSTPMGMGIPSLSTQSLQTLHSMNSPGSSPTTGEFPNINMPQTGQHRPNHSLSRQHSFQHVGFSTHGDSSPGSPGEMTVDVDFVDDDDPDAARVKRQRMDDNGGMRSHGSTPGSSDALSALSSPVNGPGMSIASGAGLSPPKKNNRNRSDSAPQGHPGHGGFWPGSGPSAAGPAPGGMGRPRSGSGMAPHHPHPHMRATIPLPNAMQQGMARGGLNIMTVPSNAPMNR